MKKYGYKMYDCTLDEFYKYEQDSYASKQSSQPEEKWEYVDFESVDQAKKLIDMVFIPSKTGNLGKQKWFLDQKNLLILKIEFKSGEDSYQYQCAVERAWALGGHLDPRVKQIYYD